MINKIMENGIKEMSLCTIFYFAEKQICNIYIRENTSKKMQRLYNGLVFAGALNFE
jgi:hypothetical protein